MIPYGKQNINQADIDSVVEVLKSDFITQGPAIERFERAVAEFTGAKYAVAVSNATAALHIGCLSLGLQEGDIAWTSPNTFVASANCVLYCGAEIDFVDIDAKTYNISVSELERKLSEAEKKGKLPKVIIPVHFSGQSCDMKRIHALSRKYDFKIIEDASHAIGGKYNNKPVGNCEFSDMAVFSFHPVKIITTGEGGMVVTNNEQLYNKLIRLRSHGITREASLMTEPSHGPWYYQQIDLGYNFRMTDIQAALGTSQMKRLDEFVKRRHQIAERYDRLLADLPVTLPYQDSDTYSAFHLYVIRLQLVKIKLSHRAVFENLRENGIGVQLHYIPVHTQPYYQNLGFNMGDFPATEKYYSEIISLPMYYDLDIERQEKVIKTLAGVLDK